MIKLAQHVLAISSAFDNIVAAVESSRRNRSRTGQLRAFRRKRQSRTSGGQRKTAPNNVQVVVVVVVDVPAFRLRPATNGLI